jgi:hypothetical protein
VEGSADHYELGAPVQVQGLDQSWRAAVIIGLNNNGTFDVQFDRGLPNIASSVRPEDIRPAQGNERLILPGCNVVVRYGARYFKGRVMKINKDNTFKIQYEERNGLIEDGVPSPLVRRSYYEHTQLENPRFKGAKSLRPHITANDGCSLTRSLQSSSIAENESRDSALLTGPSQAHFRKSWSSVDFRDTRSQDTPKNEVWEVQVTLSCARSQFSLSTFLQRFCLDELTGEQAFVKGRLLDHSSNAEQVVIVLQGGRDVCDQAWQKYGINMLRMRKVGSSSDFSRCKGMSYSHDGYLCNILCSRPQRMEEKTSAYYQVGLNSSEEMLPVSRLKIDSPSRAQDAGHEIPIQVSVPQSSSYKKSQAALSGDVMELRTSNEVSKHVKIQNDLKSVDLNAHPHHFEPEMSVSSHAGLKVDHHNNNNNMEFEEKSVCQSSEIRNGDLIFLKFDIWNSDNLQYAAIPFDAVPKALDEMGLGNMMTKKGLWQWCVENAVDGQFSSLLSYREFQKLLNILQDKQINGRQGAEAQLDHTSPNQEANNK